MGLGKTFLLAAVVGLAVSCSPESKKLVPPPAKNELRKNTSKAAFNPKVDILFVIDNSGSMDVHQNNLASNVEKFTAGIQNNAILDYHIGVTTTSVDEFRIPGYGGWLSGSPLFVERTTPNAMQALANNMHVGIDGSATEAVFQPVVMAFDPANLTGHNRGFYRPEAQLVVVFITDAEDQSVSTGPEQLIQFLTDLKGGDLSQVLSYAVYVPSSVVGCPRDQGMTLPLRIEDFLDLAKAKAFSLCDPDFGKKLGELGDDLVKRIGRVILLDRVPDINSIRVQFGTQSIAKDPVGGWAFDPARNALVLGSGIQWTEQPVGTQLEIEFEPLDSVLPKQ